MNKYNLSRKLGFFTGPLMIILGILGLTRNMVPRPLAWFMLVFGSIRILITAYTTYLEKKKNTDAE